MRVSASSLCASGKAGKGEIVSFTSSFITLHNLSFILSFITLSYITLHNLSFTSSFIIWHYLIYHRRGTHYQMLAHFLTISISLRVQGEVSKFKTFKSAGEIFVILTTFWQIKTKLFNCKVGKSDGLNILQYDIGGYLFWNILQNTIGGYL